MKVVIFIDWFAPAYKAGGPIQSIVNLVNQELEGVEYRIICSNKDVDGQSLQGVNYDRWVKYNGSTEVWYNSRNSAMTGLLKKLVEWKPDIFFINGLYSFYYNFLPIVRSRGIKKIISARGMLHSGALSQKSFKKKIYLQLWKFLGLHKSNSFHATTSEEKEFIQGAFGKDANVYIAQNLPRVLQSISLFQKQKNALKLISIGLISPMKNYLEVIKSLQHCHDNVEYSIFGAVKDPEYWQLCQTEIKKLPSHIVVKYHGDLPSAQVQNALGNAEVFILPSKSENFGHAIFEALTAGRPVITSHNTPWNNLKQAKAGLNVTPTDNYELSKAICFFARMDSDELKIWSEGAKKYAEKEIDIELIKGQYMEMFSVA